MMSSKEVQIGMKVNYVGVFSQDPSIPNGQEEELDCEVISILSPDGGLVNRTMVSLDKVDHWVLPSECTIAE